jgi:hypothetical protein
MAEDSRDGSSSAAAADKLISNINIAENIYPQTVDENIENVRLSF